jgi:hypothetical protein
MDQIAGFIVRDPKLIDQGKREWRKAAAIREKKRRAARGETTLRNTGSKVTKGSGSGAHAQKKSSSSAAKGKATGFLSLLFRKKKPLARAPSSGAVRRALTKPGQHRTFRFVQLGGGDSLTALEQAQALLPSPVVQPMAGVPLSPAINRLVLRVDDTRR